MFEGLVPGAGKCGHGGSGQGGGELHVISPADRRAGCAQKQQHRLPDPASHAVRSAAASAWASRGRVAAAMGSTSRPPGASRSASTWLRVRPTISVRKVKAAQAGLAAF